jgi:transposase-like protein
MKYSSYICTTIKSYTMNIPQLYKQFPTQIDCIKHLEQVRWNSEPTCPYCNSKNQSPLPKENRYHCNTCNTSFSVTVGTIFHKTRLDLQKWFLAVSLVLNAKKGYSARQLGRDLDVTKDTAWRMFMQIRKAMVEQRELMTGIVEADETYIGGKDKNRHNDKKKPGGQGGANHTPVVGVLQRDGKVVAKKVSDTTKKTLKRFINDNVAKGSTLATDEHRGYNGMDLLYDHIRVNHKAKQYVKGVAHTNSLEGFWSLFKRGIVGQYHQISDRYIDKYLNEFCFRYGNRNVDTNVTFDLIINRSLNLR